MQNFIAILQSNKLNQIIKGSEAPKTGNTPTQLFELLQQL